MERDKCPAPCPSHIGTSVADAPDLYARVSRLEGLVDGLRSVLLGDLK